MGAPINLKESAKWRRKAAGQGDGKAARALGNMYLAGQGVSADKSLAFLWMRRAAASLLKLSLKRTRRGNSDLLSERGKEKTP